MGRESKVRGARREMRLIAVAVSGSEWRCGLRGGSETRPYWGGRAESKAHDERSVVMAT
jgi:hypothetical protein